MKKINYKILLTLAIACFYIIAVFFLGSWKGTMKNGDTSGYYLHTVSILLYDDAGDYTKSLEAFFEEYPSQITLKADPFWMKESAIGRKFIKYSLGVSVMEVPAFLVAHLIANSTSRFNANGFSPPYIFAINFIQIIYLCIAIYLLALILESYFSKQVVIWSLLCVACGTNIFIQTTFLTIAHVFLFFNFSLLIYLTKRFYESPGIGKAIAIGVVVGLIALLRVPEITSMMIPLFWGIYNKSTFDKRIKFIGSNFGYFLAAGFMMVIVFAPQLYYWYFVSGEMFINPYEGEGFNFLEPHILKGWFSYQNGWLIYTPIMIFSLLGLPFLYSRCKDVILPLLTFVGINCFIHYSYYVWNYYPGMGSRVMIESYPLLIFAFAAFLSVISKSRLLVNGLKVVLILLVALNLLQSWQFRQGILWTARANKAFYWELFGNVYPTKESLRAFDCNEFQPDSSDLDFIREVYFNSYEKEAYVNGTSEYSYSGGQALMIKKEFPDTVRSFNLGTLQILPKDYLFVEIKAYRPVKEKVLSRDDIESLVLRIYDENKNEVKWTNVKMANHIDNAENIIGNFHTIGKWGSPGFFVQIPAEANSNWSFDVLLWNPKRLELVVDDLKVSQFRKN